jgi:hypothetical protein
MCAHFHILLEPLVNFHKWEEWREEAELGIVSLKINVFKAYSVGFFQKLTFVKRIALIVSEI